MDNLAERLKAIPTGTALTLVLADIFGSPFDYKVSHVGTVEQYGYYCKGGGWGLYKSEGDVECYRILVKPYRKRNTLWLKIGQKVIDYRLGWGD
jgi:hypothetical protein